MKREKKIRIIKRIATVLLMAVAILIAYGCQGCARASDETEIEIISGSVDYSINNSINDAVNDSINNSVTNSVNNSIDDLLKEKDKDGFTEKTQGSVKPTVAVYVCGAVKSPGVYYFDDGARVADAVKCAGGLKKNACELSVNMAQTLTDGQMIIILTADEYENRTSTGIESVDACNSLSTNQTDTKVDINLAGIEQLKSIPGIGESKARSIIEYRENNGAFSTIDDIKNVSGIADGIFLKIKDYIVVNP